MWLVGEVRISGWRLIDEQRALTFKGGLQVVRNRDNSQVFAILRAGEEPDLLSRRHISQSADSQGGLPTPHEVR